MRDVLLRKASGYEFYNISKYTFEKLLDDPDNIEENFHDYLNGFSENVRDIIEKLYLFRTPLVKNDIRVSVQRFADSRESIDSMLAG